MNLGPGTVAKTRRPGNDELPYLGIYDSV